MAEPAEETDRWLTAQIKAAAELVEVGSEALRRRRTGAGAEALEEAEAILDMAERETDDLLQMRARVFNEQGVVFQRRGQLEKSRDYHGQAAEICDELLDRGRDFASNAAATNLNLSSILLALDDQQRAEECGRKALDLLEQQSDADDEDKPANPLELGARQNLAVIFARQKRWDEANEMMERAGQIADELADAGRPNYLGQLAQGCQQLSVIFFDNEEFDDALRWGRRAEELSERGYQTLGRNILPIYIVSQINLISYYEKLGRYADAEDCLWKALDVAGNEPRILARGVGFYETCRKQADKRLEEGNLPRDEVQEGYDELMEQVEAAGGLSEVRKRAQAARRRR